MKTLKTLLSAFAMVALFATGAMAQGNASISATADVVADITLTGEQNLDFGVMTDTEAGTGITVANDNTNLETLGKFALSSVSGDIVMLISGPDSLTSSSPTLTTSYDNLELNLTAQYTEQESDPAGTGSVAFSFTGNEGEASKATPAATSWVYVGGTVGGTAGNYQGLYSGDITLSVYYD